MSSVVIFLFVGLLIVVHAELCQRPQVQSKVVYIYRLRDTKAITVYNCFHIKSTTIAYSDITDRCLKSLRSGIFVDKFNNTNSLVQHKGSQGYVVSYSARADRVENKVLLRSGTVCNYDRGFCYDSKENSNYAAVWDIDLTPGTVTGDLIYQGIADIWSFKNNSLHYLFHETKNKNEAFSFQLLKAKKIRNIMFWYTEKKFIVADGPLFGLKLLPVNFKELRVGTKSQVSEIILKSCDIQSLEFTKSLLPISEEYFTDPNNLKTILRTYGETISTVNQQITEIQIKSNDQKKIEGYVNNLEIILKKKDDAIEILRTNILKLNSTLLNYIAMFEKSQKKLIDVDPKGLVDLKNKLNIDFNQLKNKLDLLTNDLSEQAVENSEVSKKLKLLNNILLKLDVKNTKVVNELKELQAQVDITSSQKQVIYSTADTVENIKNKIDSLSEKHSLILKLIERNKNTNLSIDQKLINLNRSIFDINDNNSLSNYYTKLNINFDNKIKNLHNLLKNFEETYTNEIQEKLDAEHEKLVDKYNLQMTRLFENELLTSKLKKELEMINDTIANIYQENKQYNNSILQSELTMLQQIDNFQNICKADMNNLVGVHNKTLAEIKSVNEKYTEVMDYFDSMKTIDEIYKMQNQENIKNLSLSCHQNHKQIDTVLNNIQSLSTINKSVTRNTLQIDNLFIRLETEKNNVQSINLTVAKLFEEGKIFKQNLNDLDTKQESTANVLNDHKNNLQLIKGELHLAMKGIKDNKEALHAIKSECNECTTSKFNTLDEKVTDIRTTLVRKDEDISECQTKIKILAKKHDEEIEKLSKKHEEDITKLREEISNLREEILETFIPPN